MKRRAMSAKKSSKYFAKTAKPLKSNLMGANSGQRGGIRL